MKPKLLLVLSFFYIFSLSAQTLKLKDIKDIQTSKIIIGLTGNKKLDTYLKNITHDFWTLCPVDKALPVDEALEKAKNDNQLYVLHLGAEKGNSFTHESVDSWRYEYISNGKHIALSSGDEDILIKSYIPAYGNHVIPEESIVHGLRYIQEVCTLMIEKEIKKSNKAISEFQNNNSNLKEKTLLFPKDWLDNALTEKKIKKMYKGIAEVVSHKEWKNAILKREKNKAYVIVIPIPVEEGYSYQHHICDTETNAFYGVLQPKKNTVHDKEHLSKSKYINKKHIKKCNALLED